MKPDLVPVGHRWRTFFYTWKVEADEHQPVYFPWSAGFGCGASIKIAKGEKSSLQTQFKRGEQLGGKIGAFGSEISTTTSSETSEMFAYELSAGVEWSYTSRPCEFCAPQVHFPDARVRVLSRSTMHIPLFATKKTIFLPGETYEIMANCRHAPEKCANCNDAAVPPGGGSIVSMTGSGGPAHLERVTFAARDPAQHDIKELLKEILSAPDDKTIPEQFYLVDLAGRIQSTSRAGCLLYSLDDIDRTIGAVRLNEMNSRLLLLMKAPEKQAVKPPGISVELNREGNPDPLAIGTVKRSAEEAGYHLVEVDIPSLLQMKDKEGDWGSLRLRVHDGEITQEWPAVVLDQTVRPGASGPSHPRTSAPKGQTRLQR